MRRLMLTLAGGLLATTLAAGPAWSQSTTTTTTKVATAATTTPKHVLRWRDISGVFRTSASADKRLAALQAKGVTGFQVLALHQAKVKTRFEVEQTFATHTAARAEAAKVRAAGFAVRIVAI